MDLKTLPRPQFFTKQKGGYMESQIRQLPGTFGEKALFWQGIFSCVLKTALFSLPDALFQPKNTKRNVFFGALYHSLKNSRCQQYFGLI